MVPTLGAVGRSRSAGVCARRVAFSVEKPANRSMAISGCSSVVGEAALAAVGGALGAGAKKVSCSRRRSWSHGRAWSQSGRTSA